MICKTTSIIMWDKTINHWPLVGLNGFGVLWIYHSPCICMKAYTRLIQTSDKEKSSWRVPVNPSFVRALNSRLSHSFIQTPCRACAWLASYTLTRNQIHSLDPWIPWFSRPPLPRERVKEDEAGGGIRASEPSRVRENGPRYRPRRGCTANTDRKMAHFYRYNADIR